MLSHQRKQKEARTTPEPKVTLFPLRCRWRSLRPAGCWGGCRLESCVTDPGPKKLVCDCVGQVRKECWRGLGKTKSALVITAAVVRSRGPWQLWLQMTLWKQVEVVTSWSEMMHQNSSSALRLIDVYFFMLVQVLMRSLSCFQQGLSLLCSLLLSWVPHLQCG